MEFAADMSAHARDARDAFGELLQRHRGIVFKVAGMYARQPEDRADLEQEIATQLWRAWPGYDPARSVTTWMYRIALNVAIGHVRDNARRLRHSVPLDETLHEPADDGLDHATRQQVEILHRCIDALPAMDRALLLLYLEQRSTREIAEVIGISETNVTTRIGRLKRRIRDQF